MHHMQKAKYLSLKKEGMEPQVLEMLMLEAGIDPDEVAAFINEPLNDGDESGEGAKGAAKTPKSKKVAEASTNSIYEEWKMGKSFDGNNKIALEKVKKIRDKVKMDPSRAERLNEHAENRLVKYFLKEN